MNVIVYKSRKIISVIVAAVMFIICMTYNTILETSAVNTALNYKVFNASNGNYMSTYTLSANAVQDNSRSVIEPDTRVVDFDKSGVVKIITNSGTSTGFLIDGNTVATAAHCVVNKTNNTGNSNSGKIIEKILVFNTDKTIAYEITNAYSVHVPSLYFTTSSTSTVFDYDYALITIPNIDEDENLDDYAIFNLGVMLDGFKGSGKSVSVTGFPKRVDGEEVNNETEHEMYTGVGTIASDPTNHEMMFRHNCDTSGSNSGSPVYTSTTYGGNTYYTVIGIHTSGYSGYNIATRITTNVLHFYNNNSNKVWR